MVSTVDGRTAVSDKAGGIGSPVDRATMRNLRSMVDAVMVGAGTLRAEKLALGLDDGPGVAQPLAVVVSESGRVSFGAPDPARNPEGLDNHVGLGSPRSAVP